MEKKGDEHSSEIVILSSDSEKEEEDETVEEECNDGDDESFQLPDEADQSTESDGRKNRTRKKIVKKGTTTNREDPALIGRARDYVQNLIIRAKNEVNAGNDSNEDEGISIEVISEKEGRFRPNKFENEELDSNPEEEENDQIEGGKDEQWERQQRMHKIFKELRFDKPGTSSSFALPVDFGENIDENGESIAQGRGKRKRTTRNPSYFEVPGARKLRHNGRGHLVLPNGDTYDLCDCLDKECIGCNYPCSKCDSRKCSYECRKNRRTCIESIEVLGGEEIFNPFLSGK